MTVHLVKTNSNPIPPKPDDNVFKGYNPVLDRPRPSILDNYLRAFDVVFLLDDSGSVATSSFAYGYAADNLTNAGRALDLFQFKDLTDIQVRLRELPFCHAEMANRTKGR